VLQTEPDRLEKLEQLERVLQSQTLHGSESLKAFLRFVVLRAVDHHESQLKEYTIATEVFGRNNAYDPRTDSVVRVQAGRLRTKLHEYYATEGLHDRVVIDLPKGHYTPSFSYNQGPENGASVAVEGGSHVRRLRPDLRFKVTAAVLSVSTVVLVLITASYHSRVQELEQSRRLAQSEPADSQNIAPLWGEFFRTPEPILVTFSNTLFEGRAETGMKYWQPLDAAGSRARSSSGAQEVGSAEQAKAVITDHYTGVGEVMGVYALGNLFWRVGQPFRVKRSLTLTWDDLRSQNVVVLGSVAENRLLQDLPQKQDFVFCMLKDEKQKERYGIKNLRPQQGEQEAYFAKEEGPSSGQVVEDYAVISSLEGLDSKRRLMILAGIKTYGTQAAAEYVSKAEFIGEMVSRLNTAADGSPAVPPYFQVLIKVRINGGVPVQTSYVTHHVLH
jgi:hypothetical protein